MVVSNEIKEIISFLSNGMIWVYIGVFFLISYLLISLLTWSFIKPLKYLGIPTILVGVLLIIVRFTSNIIITLINSDELNMIKVILPNLLKPMLINGIICVLIGIGMVVGYSLINKRIENKDDGVKD